MLEWFWRSTIPPRPSARSSRGTGVYLVKVWVSRWQALFDGRERRQTEARVGRRRITGNGVTNRRVIEPVCHWFKLSRCFFLAVWPENRDLSLVDEISCRFVQRSFAEEMENLLSTTRLRRNMREMLFVLVSNFAFSSLLRTTSRLGDRSSLKRRSSNQFGILLLGSEAKKLHEVVAPNSDRVSNSGVSVFSDRTDVIILRMLWNHILWLLKDTAVCSRGLLFNPFQFHLSFNHDGLRYIEIPSGTN